MIKHSELNKNHYRILQDLAKQVDKVLSKNEFITPEELENKLYDFKLRPIPNGNNGVIRWLDCNYYDGHTYTIVINQYFSDYDNTKHYWKIFNSMTEIDGEVISLDWIKVQLKNDLLGIRQKQWLEAFSLQPLETLISTMLGTPIKLEKEIYEYAGEWKMRFRSTENLIDKAGICKWIMKDLRVNSFGSCLFYFDKDSGEQKLSIPLINFSYEHTYGGSNVYDLVKVHYDMYSGNWYYIKDGVAFTFYDANQNEYKNMPATV